MPFTHTFAAGEPLTEGTVSGNRRVGRWPGLVAIWWATGGRVTPRLRRPWNWLLYGKRFDVTTYFPAVSMTFEAVGTIDPAAGPLMKAMFGESPEQAPTEEGTD